MPSSARKKNLLWLLPSHQTPKGRRVSTFSANSSQSLTAPEGLRTIRATSLRQKARRQRPIRLVVQDTALSRREQGFEPLMGRFFFNVAATSEIYTLSLHDALPI